MEFIDEMDGFRYSNMPENVEKYGFRAQTLEEIAMRLNEYDLIIPTRRGHR